MSCVTFPHRQKPLVKFQNVCPFFPTVGGWLHNNALVRDPLFHHRRTLAPFLSSPCSHQKCDTVSWFLTLAIRQASLRRPVFFHVTIITVAFVSVTLYMWRVLCWVFSLPMYLYKLMLSVSTLHLCNAPASRGGFFFVKFMSAYDDSLLSSPACQLVNRLCHSK